jgi:Rps23 Pro-64 3,4-dihydroxylase Tpa1-like proline 4-hydroxylase
MLRQLNREQLRKEFSEAKPFPFVKIEEFLEPAFAQQVAAAYPSFDDALNQGRTFTTVNERKKVQITKAELFAPPIGCLNEALASPQFLADLSYITAMPNLLADAELVGGGMHITGPGGRLDVHLDFNYMEERKLHRRLNLLLYLNPLWEKEWGGDIQLWDKDVKHCEASFSPTFNRCVIFETNEISYHGVVPVSPAANTPRQSFATYYYTREAPAHWTGLSHSTVFKARPDEQAKAMILMPAESAKRKLQSGIKSLKDGMKGLVGR